jgi:hypothetical protein
METTYYDREGLSSRLRGSMWHTAVAARRCGCARRRNTIRELVPPEVEAMPIDLITLEHYFGPYWGKGEDTPEMRAAATWLLAAVNRALEAALADGVALVANPKTGSYVSGEGNGGFRDSVCAVGPATSKHRSAHAVDIYDPLRLFARWCLRNEARLRAIGIAAMERPEWTPTWTHLQDLPVRSGTWCFVPSETTPLASALPEQEGAA